MQAEIARKSRRAAQFFFDTREFFKQLGLLMSAISQELLSIGFVPSYESYGLRYGWLDSDPYAGFKIVRGCFGRFYESKEKESAKDKQALHYTYGFFLSETDPNSKLAPWIPLVYFIRAELVNPASWDISYNERLFQTWIQSETDSFIVDILPEQRDALADICGKLKIATLVAVPLGAMDSTDTVGRVVRLVVDALRNRSARFLEKLNEIVVTPTNVRDELREEHTLPH